ncbi:hypothetical protein CCB80_09080 [Armatimonadetes bacterium Uphvl-Ar1]|nr:hypothetical protein CCB80_09080 [Armatimonadetes bacterium Uphvl-Ar1]
MANKISRRSILAGAGAVVGSTVVSLPGMASFVRPIEKRAKNIIFCVSDGMSAGVPSMADQFKDVNFGERGTWRTLMLRPDVVQGVMDTRSLNSLMTDSAAAATSWGSGSLVLNGAINYLPGIGELTPLYDLLGKAGMRRGLVTTATITHATPSGFAVSSAKRSAEPEIARQYLTRGVEVLMGAGMNFSRRNFGRTRLMFMESLRRRGMQSRRIGMKCGRMILVASWGFMERVSCRSRLTGCMKKG